MSTTPAPCKLWILFASQAPVAVILRRGPSGWSQLVLWETDTDTFMVGQWVRGRITHPTLSPDGRYLAMEMMGGKSRIGSWEDTQYTFISRPPYFTALAISIGGLCWNTIGFDSQGRLAWGPGEKIQWRAENPCPLQIDGDLHEIIYGANKIDTRFEQTEWTSPGGRQFHAKDGVLYEGDRLLIDLNPYQPTQIETPDWALRW